LGGDGVHAVEDCEGADGFHYRPGPFPGEVEARVDGGFALRVEVCEPLGCGELGGEGVSRLFVRVSM
jgi:hypothetical protein